MGNRTCKFMAECGLVLIYYVIDFSSVTLRGLYATITPNLCFFLHFSFFKCIIAYELSIAQRTHVP
jgi:hypothetical protein